MRKLLTLAVLFGAFSANTGAFVFLSQAHAAVHQPSRALVHKARTGGLGQARAALRRGPRRGFHGPLAHKASGSLTMYCWGAGRTPIQGDYLWVAPGMRCTSTGTSAFVAAPLLIFTDTAHSPINGLVCSYDELNLNNGSVTYRFKNNDPNTNYCWQTGTPWGIADVLNWTGNWVHLSVVAFGG